MKAREKIYIAIAVLVLVGFRISLIAMRGEMNSEYRAAHPSSEEDDFYGGNAGDAEDSVPTPHHYQRFEVILSTDRTLPQQKVDAIKPGMNFDEVLRALSYQVTKDSEKAHNIDTASKGLLRFENPDSSDVLVDFIEGKATGVRRVHVFDPASLTKARRGFETDLVPSTTTKEPVVSAPPKIFRTIKYSAPQGAMAAYLSPDPRDGKKHPAIIWITGGDCNSIGDVWTTASRANDQTAAAYRNAGIVMMFPSLRGGNNNPGQKEGFLGEVDDVLAAAKYLENQSYVDPHRIYLGGHSTGGTLALLVAESSSRFRAVFSFGPVYNVASYGADSGFLPFNIRERKEVALRAMAKASTNPKAHFIEVKNAAHFNVLAPTNELIARKILRDTGETTNVSLTEDEFNRHFDLSHTSNSKASKQ